MRKTLGVILKPYFLAMGAYGATATLILFALLPFWSLFTFLSLPLALSLVKSLRRDVPIAFVMERYL